MLSPQVKTWLAVVLLVACLIVMLSMELIIRAQTAQGPCGYPLVDSNTATRFPRGATVKFQLSDNITEPARTQILNAIQKWNTANQANGSGIKFEIGSENDTYGLRIQFGSTSTGQPAQTDYTRTDSNGFCAGAAITINPNHFINEVSPLLLMFDPNADGYNTVFEKVMLHEIGHTLGLDHRSDANYDPCNDDARGATVMNGLCSPNDNNGDGIDNLPLTIQSCDNQAVNQSYPSTGGGGGGGGGSPPPPSSSSCNGNCNIQAGAGGSCPPYRSYMLGCCCYWSPVLIDVDGDGFDMSDVYGGVQFDAGQDGYPDQVAWTILNSDDAWLALDRNNNGLIDNGLELFGNFTEQPLHHSSTEANGFLALAVFDQPTQGGNADGVIDSQDAVFTNLRLWQDRNHNGVSEASELFALPALDVEAIELNYRESKRTDQHGNRFRYRAKVKDAKGAKVNRWAWDVFPVVNPPPL